MRASKEEYKDFLKELKQLHKANGWLPLPRKTKCVECKTYNHEVANNLMMFGNKLCHACNNVKQADFNKSMEEVKKRTGFDPRKMEDLVEHSISLEEGRAISKEYNKGNR